MDRQIDPVYENGILRPLEPLPFAEREIVHLTSTTAETDPLESLIDHESLKTITGELKDLGRVPTLAEVQEMLSHDKSSCSDTVIAGRQER